MKKSDLIEKMARENRVETATAADQVDGVVHKILQALRRGSAARLPGLGTIRPGNPRAFHQERKGGGA